MKNSERKQLAKGAILAASLTAGVVAGFSMYNEAHATGRLSAGYVLVICAGGKDYGCLKTSEGSNCGAEAPC